MSMQLQASASITSFRSRFLAVLKQFKNGSIKLMKDGRLKISLKPEDGKIYTTQEIISYHEFRRDLTRILPAFVLFWIPIVGYATVPLVMIFPRQLLSRQFWTDEQRILAYDYALKRREEAYDSLSQSLVTTLEHSLADKKLVNICVDCLDNIKEGHSADIEETQMFRDVLSHPMLQIETMPDQHRMDLASTLNVHEPVLKNHAVYLNNADRSIVHHGIESLSQDIFDLVCHQRGAPLSKVLYEEHKQYLKDWLKQTKDMKEKDLSFMLHLPFLLQNAIRVRERPEIHDIEETEV